MALLKDLQTAFATKMADYTRLSAQADLSAEDHQRLDALVDDMKAEKAQIEKAQEGIKLAEWGQKSAGSLPLVGANAPAGTVNAEGWTPADDEEGFISEEQFKAIRTPEYKAAFRGYLRSGISGLKSADIKVLQEGSDTAGGYLVPEDILARVISKEPTPTRVAGRVTQLNTSRDSLVIPKVNYASAAADDASGILYTTGIRASWTGEIPASATQHRVTEPVFGQERIPVYTAMLSMPLTNDMVEDAAFPIVSYASGKFSETVDLLRDYAVLSGTGVDQPSGILVNPGGTNQPAVVNSGAATVLTADGLFDLTLQLPEQYDDNAAAVFNKVSTLRSIAKFKDGNGRYLSGAGLQDSGLATSPKGRMLLGYDVILSGFMPSEGAGNFPVIFGDLRGYYLVNRIGFSIQVLRELYAETNQVLLLGRVRFGGKVAEPWKLYVQKCSA